MKDNINELTTKDLLERSKEIERELQKRKKNDLRQAYKEFQSVARIYNTTIEEVIEKGKPVKLDAKYRDPNSEQEWSGYGKQPNWVRSYIAEGGKLEDLLI